MRFGHVRNAVFTPLYTSAMVMSAVLVVKTLKTSKYAREPRIRGIKLKWMYLVATGLLATISLDAEDVVPIQHLGCHFSIDAAHQINCET